jgi:hypothetical protein
VPGTTGPFPARSVCTWVWVTLNGAVTTTLGAVVSVDPVTATLPVVPASVQSGVPPFGGAAVGQEPAAVAVPEPANVRTVAATQAASATEEYTRGNFTAVTLQPLIASLTGSPGYSSRPHSRTKACTLMAVKAALLAGAFLVAVPAFTPSAAADPHQFPGLSDYYTVNAADYRTYRAYGTAGVQFATPGGYRCRMNYTFKQGASYMQCWGTLPGTPNNHVELAYLGGNNTVDAAFSTIDLSTMENVAPGADGSGGRINPQDYKLLPTRNRVVYSEGPVQTCGVDTSMTACELTDHGQQHGFVLSPQGGWTF